MVHRCVGARSYSSITFEVHQQVDAEESAVVTHPTATAASSTSSEAGASGLSQSPFPSGEEEGEEHLPWPLVSDHLEQLDFVVDASDELSYSTNGRRALSPRWFASPYASRVVVLSRSIACSSTSRLCRV